MKKLAAALVALVLLSLAAVAYCRVGWGRMEAACSLSDEARQIHSSVTYAWTWQPLGFTCTYDDGGAETSLWF